MVIGLTKKSNNPNNPYVTRSECARISGQIREELKVLKSVLVGEDMRGGMNKEIGDIKRDLCHVKEYIDNQKTKGRDWRMLGFAILGSVISGAVIAALNYFLH